MSVFLFLNVMSLQKLWLLRADGDIAYARVTRVAAHVICEITI